jgi:hypothetical protein
MEFVGLFGGMAIGLMGWYFGRRAARKNRGLDEVHEFIWQKARSVSWYVTLAAIYVLLILGMFQIELGLIPALGILLLAHLGSWSIAGAILMARLVDGDHRESGRTQALLMTMIGIVLLIGFGLASALTGNWKFLLFSLFPVLFMMSITFFQVKARNHRHRNGA